MTDLVSKAMGTRSAVSSFFLDIRGCAIFVGAGIQYQRSSHNPLVSLNFGKIPAVVLGAVLGSFIYCLVSQ